MVDSVGDSSGFGTAAAALLRCFIPSNICSVCCMSCIVSRVWSRGDGGVLGFLLVLSVSGMGQDHNDHKGRVASNLESLFTFWQFVALVSSGHAHDLRNRLGN